MSLLQLPANVIVVPTAVALARPICPDLAHVLSRALTARQRIRQVQIRGTAAPALLLRLLQVHALALGVIREGHRLVRLAAAASHLRHDKVQVHRLLPLHRAHLIVVVAAARVRRTPMQDRAMRNEGAILVRVGLDHARLRPPALRLPVNQEVVLEG